MVKVGDRVRSLVDETDLCSNKIYEVVSVGRHSVNVEDDAGDEHFLFEDEYEPVAVADSNGNVEHGNSFKVGDRVRRILRDNTNGLITLKKGTVSTVVEVTDNGWVIVGGYESLGSNDPDCFEPVDAPLTIRSGKFYRTRDGRKVGPMRKWYHKDTDHPWEDGDTGDIYSDDGTSYYNEDIIAEWVDEPVAAGDSSNADIFDELEDWMADNPLSPTVTPTPTTGFTVPLDAPEFGGAESKFKVGDRVEIIDVGSCPERYLGTQFTIDNDEDDFDGEQAWSGKDHNSPYRFKESQLRLVAEATTAQEPPTTIADIVRRLERLESAMWQRAA